MKKLLCLFVAILMIMGTMVACGNTGDDTTEPVNNDVPNTPVDPITINIYVRASETGEDVYASDINGYEYTLADRTVLAILEDFMLCNFDVEYELGFDDSGKLVKVGDIEADATQLWLVNQASAPKGADDAKPIDGDIDTYSRINDGDTLVIYLS